MELNRRQLLSYGVTTTVAAPLLVRRGNAATTGTEVGEELMTQVANIVASLGEMASNPRKPLLDSATAIGKPYEGVVDTIGVNQVHELAGVKTVSDPVGRVIMKTLNVCRDYFGLGINPTRFAKYLFTISSIGGIMFGVAAVGQSAYKLFEANVKRGVPRAKVDGGLFRDYVLSILGLAMEIALIAVPFSFKPAWRGTRFIANRTLLRVRRYADGKYANAAIAVVMSILHWTQRALIDNSLTNLSGTADFVENVGKNVQEQTRAIQLDCSLNTETDEITTDFELLDVTPKTLEESFKTFLQTEETSLGQLAGLLGEELATLGFEGSSG